MWSKNWFGTAVALVAMAIGAQRGFAAQKLQDESNAQTVAAPPEALRAVDGEWIFVEDRTEGRTLEQLTSPMSSSFSMKVESDAVILNGHGSGHKDVRVALDGTATERPESERVVRYRGGWQDGAFTYEVSFERNDGTVGSGLRSIRRSFRPTADGLLVTVTVEWPAGTEPPVTESIGLYRHAEDIPMPTPAKAVIGDLAWLAGDWVGTKSTGSSIEERWSPPLGGAMLAVSRTVNKSGKMVGFEYVRIVERDGGLVYIAQPAGRTATEFVLSEWTPSRAVFANPRHDYPKRIVYELSADGVLSTSVGFMKGGTPQVLNYKLEVIPAK
ncbi:MAG: hypothetical protein RIR10_738 [Planctomycetota bacterium]|jgi:hypothetical protein